MQTRSARDLVRGIIARFGGAAAMANAMQLSTNSAIIRMWSRRGYIPAEWFNGIVAAGERSGVVVTLDELAAIAEEARQRRQAA
jgi:hypothetical protein